MLFACPYIDGYTYIRIYIHTYIYTYILKRCNTHGIWKVCRFWVALNSAVGLLTSPCTSPPWVLRVWIFEFVCSWPCTAAESFHTYICVCECECMYVCININTCKYIVKQIAVCDVYENTHTHTHICYTHVTRTYMSVCAYTHTHTHKYQYTHTHIADICLCAWTHSDAHVVWWSCQHHVPAIFLAKVQCIDPVLVPLLAWTCT